MSLDGYIEGPHHELDWSTADDELHDFFTNLLRSSDLIFYGRVTYQLMQDYWPTASQNPTLTAAELRFADAINSIDKIVYSSTLKNVSWNTQLFSVFNPGEVRQMKAKPGRDILLGGGATIAQAFMQQGLIDEYQLVVHPAAIGAGKALFGGLDQRLKLNYLWNKPFSSGAVALCYQPGGNL